MEKKFNYGFEIMFYEITEHEQLWQFQLMMKEILLLQRNIIWKLLNQFLDEIY
jgi:hypothetical protein